MEVAKLSRLTCTGTYTERERERGVYVCMHACMQLLWHVCVYVRRSMTRYVYVDAIDLALALQHVSRE